MSVKPMNTFATKFVVLAFLALLPLLGGCSDEISSMYSKKYPARLVLSFSSPELYNAMNTPGEFVGIKEKNGSIVFTGPFGDSSPYNLPLVDYKSARFGLGGFIVGTTYNMLDNGRFEHVAYDLACPNCDRKDRRLTLKDGKAACPHCGTTYDLNLYGRIDSVTDQGKEYRGLYRYMVSYNGLALTIRNH